MFWAGVDFMIALALVRNSVSVVSVALIVRGESIQGEARCCNDGGENLELGMDLGGDSYKQSKAMC